MFPLYTYKWDKEYITYTATSNTSINLSWASTNWSFTTTAWDWDISPAWKEGFITNYETKNIDNIIPKYEKAAKKVGTKLRIEEDAYDVKGNLIKNYSAIYLEDPEKKQNFWNQLREIEEEVKPSIIVQPREDRELSLPKLCSCSMTILMRNGCQCGGN